MHLMMDPTLESILKSIPGGSNVIDTFQNTQLTSNAKVGCTGSVTHVNGGLSAPGAIICNTSTANLELVKKTLDSIPIYVCS